MVIVFSSDTIGTALPFGQKIYILYFMDINILVKVTSRAWSLNILALMHRGTPGRQASLLSASGAGRTAFSQSLRHLIDLALLEKNPGHGHPLRPEFRLTAKGAEIAKLASRVDSLVYQRSEHSLLRRAWTVPVLIVCQGPRYFGEIKSQLIPITDRALSQSLKQLESYQWLHREIETSSRPVRPRYQAANTGAAICQAVGLRVPTR